MNCFVLRLFYSSLTQVEIQLIVNIDPLIIAKETFKKNLKELVSRDFGITIIFFIQHYFGTFS